MKKIIKRFWGVGLIVILLSTMFVGGAVPAVNAATLAWSFAGAPGAFNQVPLVASDVNIIKVASNGNIFVVDNVAATSVIWKSVDGGYSWTASAPLSTRANA